MDCDAFSFSMDTTDVGIVLLPLAGIVLLFPCVALWLCSIFYLEERCMYEVTYINLP